MAPAQGHKRKSMPSCLDGLIGSDNGCQTSTGKLFLGDIGIGAEFIKGLLGKEHATIGDFMAERRRLATEYVVRDVVNHLSSRLIGHAFIDHDRLGRWPDTEATVSASAGYSNGVMLEVCTPGSNTKITISAVEFYGTATGPVVVTAYDMSDGSVAGTLTIDATADAIARADWSLQVQCRRERKRLFITTDRTEFYKATMSKGCAKCKPDTFKHGVLNARSVRFADASKKVWANMESCANTGGLSIIASVECDHEALLCDMRPAAALPLLYRLGAEIMNSALFNFTRWGIKDLRREDVEARRDQFDAEYAKSMNDLLKWAKVPGDRTCFVCDSRTSTGVILP